MRKITVMILATVALMGCGPANSAAEADAFVNRAIIAACKDLVTDYAIARDHGDAEGYAATFAQDGELILPSGSFKGRDQLRQRLTENRGKSVSRHMMSTTQIKVVDTENAVGISYAVIYIEPAPDKGSTGAVATQGPAAIGEYRDSFRLTDQGWKFSRREFVPVFSLQVD
ncbi:MAG: nuclear transport factor 2 family protein [Pseudomonadota bacterium]